MRDRLRARRRQARSGDFNDQRQAAADSGRGRPKQRIYPCHIDQSPRDKMIAHDRKVAVADAAVDSPAKIATSALPEGASAEALSQGQPPQQRIILRQRIGVSGFKA
jgi:hypothetical protein